MVPIHTQDTEAWAMSEIAQMVWGAKPTPHIFKPMLLEMDHILCSFNFLGHQIR